MKKIIDLYPESPNTWVYRDHDDDLLPDGTPRRQFEPSVSVRIEDEHLWHECTDADKQEWEADHLPPEPEPKAEQPAGLEPEQATHADEEGGEG